MTSNHLGGEQIVTSFLWGEMAGKGDVISSCSPLDGTPLGQTRQLTQNELNLLLAPTVHPLTIAPEDFKAFAERLYKALECMSEQIFEALQRETGFVSADCREVRDGILLFVRDFYDVGGAVRKDPPNRFYEAEGQNRRLRQVAVPWGTVAVILPSSAALFLGLTCLFNALATGNRVILRFPAGCPLSAEILCQALVLAQAPTESVSVVMVPAKKLINAINQCRSSILVHYLGSSSHAASLVTQGFEHCNTVVADGEGNTWVWVSPEADPVSVAQTLTHGALRYNGQTCTSINGALIHPQIYEDVRDALVAQWSRLKTGDPRDEGTNVGPLSGEEQAKWCQERIEESGGRILCGGSREGAFLSPTLIEVPETQSELVTQGLFGPALWIASATQEQFAEKWPTNRYPLCVGLLAANTESIAWAARLGNVARVVVDADPSIEWVFEPWGGYPASGNNPVSSWADKYRRVVALDEPRLSN